MKRKDYKKAKKQTSGKRLAMKISLLVVLSAFLAVASICCCLYRKKLADAANRAYEAIDDRDKVRITR